MHGQVKRLRLRGKRLPDREISQVEPVAGALKLAGHQWTLDYVLTLQRPNDNASAPLLVLFEARMTAMHGDGMLFKGVERPEGDDGPAYVQEWSVRIYQG